MKLLQTYFETLELFFQQTSVRAEIIFQSVKASQVFVVMIRYSVIVTGLSTSSCSSDRQGHGLVLRGAGSCQNLKLVVSS